MLGELVRIYKKYGDLPLYYRDFDGILVEPGCHLISSSSTGLHYLIIPCTETETVLHPNTGKQFNQIQLIQPVWNLRTGFHYKL